MFKDVKSTINVDLSGPQWDNGGQKEFVMPKTRQELGATIRRAREARHLSIRQAAIRLGVDRSYYRGIEIGDRSLGKYARPIAQLYGLDGDQLEALASTKLPTFGPYLRAMYDLDDETIAELEEHFEQVAIKKRRVAKRRWS